MKGACLTSLLDRLPSGSLCSVGACRHAPVTQLGQDRARVHVKALTYFGQRETRLIKPHHFDGLLLGRRGTTQRYTSALQDGADRDSVTVEFVGKLVDRLSCPVAFNNPIGTRVGDTRLSLACTPRDQLRSFQARTAVKVPMCLPQFVCMRGEQSHQTSCMY